MATKNKTPDPAAKNESVYDPTRPAAPAQGAARPAKATKKTKAPKQSPRHQSAPPTPPARSALPQFEALKIQENRADLTADAGLIAVKSDERKELISDIERIRKMRKPFGSFTQKLALPVRAGYKRHWFSDEPGRIDEATQSGWSHVSDESGKPIRRVVGRGRDSGALYGYAMEIPSVFWTEDMQYRFDAAQARVDEIKKNPFAAKPGQAQKSDAGKFYSAKEAPLSVETR